MPGTGITGACCCIVRTRYGDGRSGHDKVSHPRNSTKWTCVRNGQSPNGPTEGSPVLAVALFGHGTVMAGAVIAVPAMTGLLQLGPAVLDPRRHFVREGDKRLKTILMPLPLPFPHAGIAEFRYISFCIFPFPLKAGPCAVTCCR